MFIDRGVFTTGVLEVLSEKNGLRTEPEQETGTVRTVFPGTESGRLTFYHWWC